ncbi:MAG: PepSY domain-containing protein [Terriglobales bacterium]
MKKLAALLPLVLLAGVMQAMPSGLITKFQAEQDALSAVGSGTVVQAYVEKEMGKLVWAVDIFGTSTYYQVWVDAHTGTILNVILHLPPTKTITKQQAEQIALKAAGGGKVVQVQRDQWKGYDIWDIAITQPAWEYDVYVDAHTGAVLKIIKQGNAASMKFISKAKAEQIALNAVGGGTVLLVVLEKSDNPADWSVDVKATNGNEYEVKVNAYTGKVIAIIPG